VSKISNKDRGDANHRKLMAYFDRIGSDIPRRLDGTADIARIVNEVPLTSRQVIYQNDRNKALCNERFAAIGIPAIGSGRDIVDTAFHRPGAVAPDDEKKQLKRRVDQLERELTIARGELIELRRALRRFEAMESHLAETGRLPR
jgi:hypothetical protein